MTAYRSTNAYRQDLLQYNGGVNVVVTPATVAATATVPAVSVASNSTVSLAVITGTVTVPSVTVTEGSGVSFSVTTVATAATVPSVTVTEGVGVAFTVGTISGAATAPAVTVAEGTGVSVALSAVTAVAVTPDATVTGGTGVSATVSVIEGTTNVPSTNLLMRFAPENILPQIDVVQYQVNDPARRLARFRTPGRKGRNVFMLSNGSVTTRQPHDPNTISRTLLGGHEWPTDLTSEEITSLLDSSYAVEVS